MTIKHIVISLALVVGRWSIDTVSAAVPSGAHIIYSTIAVTGQAAPAPAAGKFTTFDTVQLDIGNAGDVCFSASIQAASLSFPKTYGLWAWKNGNIQNIFQGGFNAPGVDGWVVFGPTGKINSHGEYVLESNLNKEVGYGRDDAVWFGTPTNLQLVAREGDVPPGVEPTTIYSDNYVNSSTGTTQNFDNVQLTDDSVITFTSSLRGPGVPQFEMGLWSGKIGQLQLVGRSNHQAPGLPSGVNFGALDANVVNSHGVLAFESFLSGNGIDPNDGAVWAGTPSNLTLVARTGNPAPGIPGAVFDTLTYIDVLRVNTDGNLLFRASVSGAGLNSTNDEAWWYGPISSPALLFREGQPVPGLNVSFISLLVRPIGPNKFFIDATIAGSGVNTTNDKALMIGSSTQMSIVAQEGMQAPGMAPGVVISTINGSLEAVGGAIVFGATLAGPGVTTSNDTAYFMSDTNGSFYEIIRESNLFDIGSGNLKTISSAEITFGHSHQILFNDDGQLLFKLRFTDSSEGVFIAQLVPEPGSFPLILTGLALVTRRIRGQRSESFRCVPERKHLFPSRTQPLRFPGR